jgi:dihydrofolate synthase/folylpolyglutamate synthase
MPSTSLTRTAHHHHQRDTWTCDSTDAPADIGNLERPASCGQQTSGRQRPGAAAKASNRAAEVGADLWPLAPTSIFWRQTRQWGWAGRYSGACLPGAAGANQLVNASGVLAALAALRDLLPVWHSPFGRFGDGRKLPARCGFNHPGQPTLQVAGCGAQPLGGGAPGENSLDAMGFIPTCCFGAMADRTTAQPRCWRILLIDNWYFTEVCHGRAATVRRRPVARRLNRAATRRSSPEEARFRRRSGTDVLFWIVLHRGGILKPVLPQLFAPRRGLKEQIRPGGEQRFSVPTIFCGNQPRHPHNRRQSQRIQAFSPCRFSTP